MKKILPFIVLLSACIACGNDDAIDPHTDEAPYYVKFKLNEPDSEVHELNLLLENPLSISGNDIRDSDYVAVGFGFSAAFESPSDHEKDQHLTFLLSFEVPETEFNLSDGVYEFKDPARLEAYLPSGNVFEAEGYSISTFFHEDNMSYCSAQLDPSNENNFVITKVEYYQDAEGKPAMDIEGSFTTSYNSICTEGAVFEMADGSFRIKLLIDEIP